jgi:hypothetical protein
VTGNETILARLANLLAAGALPKTACSAVLLQTLQPLIQAGVVVEERSGGGRRLAVRDAAALRQFMRRHFPNTPMGEDDTSRMAGVVRFRDSKTFASDTPEILSVRAWVEDALLKAGKPAGAAGASSEHGVFAFLLNDHYSLRGPCALVENPAVFTQFERLRLPVGLVILSGRGSASGRLLEWLGANDAPGFSLLHLPDYDPVGMDEFRRLRARLGDRVHLHVPDDLAERFARFSNRGILRKANNQALLANLRKSKLAEVARVVALIDSNNACLEQEALLLPAEPLGGGR